jgi:hypothetical protein
VLSGANPIVLSGARQSCYQAHEMPATAFCSTRCAGRNVSNKEFFEFLSKGAFDNVAMWSCAVLGADDVAYSGKALTSVLFSIITGTNLDFFGDSALQDHQFYYKQSLGLLGFALIGGQFPNLFADEKKAPVSLGDSRISARAQAMKNQSGLAFSIDALGRLQTTTAQTGKLVRSLP